MASLAQQNSGGQNHDRLPAHDDSLSLADMLPTDGGGDDGGSSSSNGHVEITAAQKMLSATSGSLLTGLLVTPLDVVRVRWQSQNVPQPVSASPAKPGLVSPPDAFRPPNLGVTACCREVFFMNNSSEPCIAGPRIGPLSGDGGVAAGECAVELTQQRTFNSTMDGLRKIARNEGLATLWRGLSPTLLMAVPANIIYFTGYEWLRFNARSPIQQRVRDDYAPLVAGSTARMLAATAVGPIELFRTRLQASHGSSAAGHLADTFRGVKDMVRLHGYRSLWRGLTLTLWRDAPFSGMYWLGYETVRGKLTDARERRRGRALGLDLDGSAAGAGSSASLGRARRLSQSQGSHQDTFMDSFVAGAVSGAFASVATMPFDVGKTRTQVYRDAAGAGSEASTAAAASSSARRPEAQSMVRLLWHIFRSEGVAGLFKGWIPRTLKVAPACAIMISSYEVGKKAFRGVNERALERRMREGRTES